MSEYGEYLSGLEEGIRDIAAALWDLAHKNHEPGAIIRCPLCTAIRRSKGYGERDNGESD